MQVLVVEVTEVGERAIVINVGHVVPTAGSDERHGRHGQRRATREMGTPAQRTQRRSAQILQSPGLKLQPGS